LIEGRNHTCIIECPGLDIDAVRVTRRTCQNWRSTFAAEMARQLGAAVGGFRETLWLAGHQLEVHHFDGNADVKRTAGALAAVGTVTVSRRRNGPAHHETNRPAEAAARNARVNRHGRSLSPIRRLSRPRSSLSTPCGRSEARHR